MADISIPGIKKATSRGKVYYYHRATGVRVKASPDDLTAFLAEVAALTAVSPARHKPVDGTLGSLIRAYKTSPEWSGLAPDTRTGYERVFNELSVLDALCLADLTPSQILQTRDRVFARHKRWLANMCVSVLSVVLGWGVPRGWLPVNVAKGVPKIRRDRKMGVANKAWLPAEMNVLLQRAMKWRGLRKAIALAYYTGLRKKDCVEVPQEARSEAGAIEWVQSKTGRTLTVFAAKRLADILNEPDAGREADTIVVTKRGQTYTRDGLDTMFHRLKSELADEGLIRKGLTFHGLRKSMGRDLAALGMSENDIAGALGHANPASARPYTAEHRQREAARKATKLLERRGKR